MTTPGGVELQCNANGSPAGAGWRRAPVLMTDKVLVSGMIVGDGDDDPRRVYLRCDPTSGRIVLTGDVALATTFLIEPAAQRALSPIRANTYDTFFLRTSSTPGTPPSCGVGMYVRVVGANGSLHIGNPRVDGRRGVRLWAEPEREEWRHSDYFIRYGDRLRLRAPIFTVNDLNGVNHASCTEGGMCRIQNLVEEVYEPVLHPQTGEPTGYTTTSYQKTGDNEDSLQWISFRCPEGGLRYFRNAETTAADRSSSGNDDPTSGSVTTVPSPAPSVNNNANLVSDNNSTTRGNNSATPYGNNSAASQNANRNNDTDSVHSVGITSSTAEGNEGAQTNDAHEAATGEAIKRQSSNSVGAAVNPETSDVTNREDVSEGGPDSGGGDDSMPAWAIVLIVIGSVLLVAVVAVAIAYVVYQMNEKKKREQRHTYSVWA